MSMRVVPESWEDFQLYWEHMCNDVLEKNKATTDLFTIMKNAPVPPIPVFRQIPDRLWRRAFPRLAPFGIWATMGLCPPAVRAKLGYRWSERDERRFQFGARMFRVAWAATPAPVGDGHASVNQNGEVLFGEPSDGGVVIEGNPVGP